MIRTFGQTLDGLQIGMCVFDTDDRAQAWNRTFLRLFPEHDGHLHEGEPYRENLRRFYHSRLSGPALEQIEEHIEAGLLRHRHQSQPYEFDHRNLRVKVSSLPLPGEGRIRLWRTEPRAASPEAPPQPCAAPTELVPLLDHVPNALMLCSADGAITWVNDPFVTMYSLQDKATALGKRFEDIYRSAWGASYGHVPPTCDHGLETLRLGLRYTGAPFDLPLPGSRTSRVVARPSAAGTRFYTHIDISELRLQQEQLARAERSAWDSAQRLARKSALLQAILENMDQGIAMINTEGVVEFHNRRVVEMLDLPDELLASQPRLQDVIAYQRSRGEFDAIPQPLQDYLAPGFSPPAQHAVERRRPNGRLIDIRSIPIASGGLLRTYTDVTEARAYEQRIEHMASHDGLTGLLNRAKFLDCLASEVALARRMHTTFAVLYLDLDGFKPVNDHHGHALGDRVLARVAHTLTHTARESDFVARLGGDEFAILQRGMNHRDQAWRLAQRLEKALQEPFTLEGVPIRIGASIGVALFPEHGTEPESLVAAADQAMYLTKAGRRSDGLLEPRRSA